jgi:hypothetical protein
LNAHSLFGLLALNLWLLVVGAALLYALRGWETWSDFLRLSGLAYLLGVSALGSLWVWELVVGIDLSFATILGTGAVIGAIALIVARRLGRRLPRMSRIPAARISVAAAVFASLTVVYLEALFRRGRLTALYEFDAWAFWVPKAKAIYYFGGLDHQFFHDLPGQSYPPLVPALEAAAFHFMGSADVVTLHLQFWFLMFGFVAALVGLLSPRVPALLLWPPLLLLLVTPRIVFDSLQPQGDFLVDQLVAVAALMLALWLAERREWFLVATTLLLGGAMLTKREGYLFGACVVLAAMGATWRNARFAWPRLVAVGVVAAAMTIPWRIFLSVRHYETGAPQAGGTGLFSHLGRVWPSLRLALGALFDFRIWLVVIAVALVAIVAALLAGARALGSYAALLYLFGLLALTWITWSFPTLPITKNGALNPIVRSTGFLVLIVPALAPLLLQAAWRGRSTR